MLGSGLLVADETGMVPAPVGFRVGCRMDVKQSNKQMHVCKGL
jgi:hypothetical protein